MPAAGPPILDRSSTVTAPDDVTGNYLALMRERGWNWRDLADDLDRQAAQPSLDGGVATRRVARWARSQQEAATERQAAHADPAAPEPRPDDATPDRPRRHATPPRSPRRG
jgi:hypothetical protein